MKDQLALLRKRMFVGSSFDIEIIEKFDEFHILHEHKKNQNPNAVSSVDPFLLRRHWVRVG